MAVLREDDNVPELDLVLLGELVDAYTNPPLRRVTGPLTLVLFV